MIASREDLLRLLHESWVRRLYRDYASLNYWYARDRLRLPIIRISRETKRLGAWDPVHRTITISETHITSQPWEDVVETLRHEMAHQYVCEVLRASGEEPHGPEFRRACEVFVIEPRAKAGELGRIDESSAERDRILARVRDLLRLATSPNEHEAASAMRMAHKYLLQYNLDLAELDGRLSYVKRHLGTSAQRIQEWEYTLAGILQDHFFVKVVWISSYDALRDRGGHLLQIIGTRENVESAEYVHNFIRNNTEPLWQAHRHASPGLRGTKLQYLAGLLRGFAEKLDAERRALGEELGLIWKGDPGLAEYLKRLHPRLRTISRGGVSRGESYAAGRSDGRKITVHRGVGGGPSSRGLLLPGGGS